MQIIPTILEKEFSKAELKLNLIKDLSNWVQIDVIDGIFGFGKTFDLELLNRLNLEPASLLMETHLMVKEPIKWIEKCLFVGVNRIIGQVEMMSDRKKFVDQTKDQGMEAGLGFDIDTNLEEIPEETDVVLLMARKAGFESMELNQKIWKKIDELQKIKKENNLKFKIGIDGGINLNNITDFRQKGVDIAYCGGAVFNGNVIENFKKLNYAIGNE